MTTTIMRPPTNRTAANPVRHDHDQRIAAIIARVEHEIRLLQIDAARMRQVALRIVIRAVCSVNPSPTVQIRFSFMRERP